MSDWESSLVLSLETKLVGMVRILGDRDFKLQKLNRIPRQDHPAFRVQLV